MYKYLLFDLDGTLTDSSEGITKCVQYALDDFGYKDQPMEKLLRFIGPSLRESFTQFYGMTEEQAEAATAKYRERFSPIGIYENRLYDGIEDMLIALYEAGYVLCLASAKPEAFVERILDYFHISQYFHIIRGSSFDTSRDTKAKVIEAVLADLPEGYQKDQVVMIGDRHHDVEGASALEVDCVGVSYGFGSREELMESGAVWVADTVEELTNYFI